jgi:hypothetical protein
MDGWLEGKANLSIVYSNKKSGEIGNSFLKDDFNHWSFTVSTYQRLFSATISDKLIKLLMLSC